MDAAIVWAAQSAYHLTFAWFVGYIVCWRAFIHVFGCANAFGPSGTPRWRCALGFFSQAVFAALCFLSIRAGETGETEPGIYQWAFCSIFCLFQMLDFVLITPALIIGVHHIACVSGTLLNLFVTTAGLPVYLPAVVIMELGTACFNVFCLYPHSEPARWIFFIGFTLSNIGSSVLIPSWHYAAAPQLANAYIRGVMSVVWIILALIRQQTCMEERPAALRWSPRPAPSGLMKPKAS